MKAKTKREAEFDRVADELGRGWEIVLGRNGEVISKKPLRPPLSAEELVQVKKLMIDVACELARDLARKHHQEAMAKADTARDAADIT